MKTSSDKTEIIRLAKEVFDYEEWFVWFTDSKGGVAIQPTGQQMQRLEWPSIQECIDDLRFRRLTRFISLPGER